MAAFWGKQDMNEWNIKVELIESKTMIRLMLCLVYHLNLKETDNKIINHSYFFFPRRFLSYWLLTYPIVIDDRRFGSAL